MALEQVEELEGLDAPRAEAWASDLLALACESLGPGGEDAVVRRLADLGGRRATTILATVRAITPDLVADLEVALVGHSPPWSDALGTSRCVEAVRVEGRRGSSIAFRFVDSDEVGHTVLVDLVPGPPEHLGEVQVTEPTLLDVLAEEDSGLETISMDAHEAASRVAAAMAVPAPSRPSAVMNGRLLVARLSALTDAPLSLPEAPPEVVPDPPAYDAEDARYALDLFASVVPEPDLPDPSEVERAAGSLRAAAARDGADAVWLAASEGPVDLDESDFDVLVAAAAATIAPRRLEPLDPDQREAVLTLEWADWLGALIELCRAGPGVPVDPEGLVDRINRCPEVTTAVSRRDRPRVAWAFAVLTEAWPTMGLVDGAGALTELGGAILPEALRRAWGR